MGIDVLIVDDDADLRSPLAELLRDEGFLVEELPDADGFLEALETWQPALVLLDLTLPGADLRMVLEEARERHLTAGRTILALTGLEDAESLAEELGLNGAIHKPFDIDEMLSRAREARRLRESRTMEPPAHPGP